MSPSMNPDDRETLSALFDGEMDGDAARFALRRLGHDAAWRDACSRWQLAGDVLRGQAAGLAPPTFAARVSAAVAADVAPLAAVSGDAPRAAASAVAQAQSRRWWGRAALAASVAVAALFVTHPFSGMDTGGDAATSGSPVALTPPATSTEPTRTAVAVADTGPDTPVGGIEVAAVAVAVADAPRRAAERRSRSSQAGTESPAMARRAEEAPAMEVAAAPAPEPALPTVMDPFKPQTAELVARPWPRAVLPGSSAAGAFTARYGTTQSSPSFYPFEPDATQAPASTDEAHPNP